MNKIYMLVVFGFLAFACSSTGQPETETTPNATTKDSGQADNEKADESSRVANVTTERSPTERSPTERSPTERSPTERSPISVYSELSDTSFVLMPDYAEGFAYDMRYATANNFLDTAVYPCANCKLRIQVAEALVNANAYFKSKGYRIKFFDCYRPVDVQKQMWKVMPDGRYVANPYKSGSIHNRGAAVDITLETLAGQELDMGTAFDYFGQEAHHTYSQLSDTVQANRILLKHGLEAAGFTALATEWWHYLYGRKSRYALTNQSLCD